MMFARERIRRLHKTVVVRITPCLRTIGNFVIGSDAQTQLVLDSGVFDEFPALLTHSKASIRKEACWTISNIAAGPVKHVRFVLDPSIIIPLLRCCEEMGSPSYVKKEALWAIANAANASEEAGDIFMQYSILETLDRALQDVANIDALRVALMALRHILRSIPKINGRWLIVEQIQSISKKEGNDDDEHDSFEAQLVHHLELLQTHVHHEVQTAASGILSTYF